MWCCDPIFFDKLEKQRALSIPERNFREIVKKHYDMLIKAQHQYWRKRCTIRWIKMGEENTKFFHAMATKRFRRSFISSLQLPDGHIVTDHDQLAAVAWNCFIDRMGSSRGVSVRFDLDSIISPVNNLDALVSPFTNEEMDKVVQKMPVDKAPGPDGFNEMFLKRCWSIIKEDFYNLANDFFSQNVSLENLNNS